MTAEYLRKSDSCNRLILIFAGWGTDTSFYIPLAEECPQGWDILVVSGYDDFLFPLSLPERYRTIYLFAWSLGVAAAERALSPERITAAFALNGTTAPVDDRYGIPVDIFNGTAETLSIRNLTKFRRRMAGSSAAYENLIPRLDAEPDIERLRHQLEMFTSPHPSQTAPRLPWRRAYCAKNDRIFPFDNQRSAWSELSPLTTVITSDDAHYAPLTPLIKDVIHNLEIVGRRFHKALDSYDRHASVQQHMALRLAKMTEEAGLPQNASILEIGPGSGILTRNYAPQLQPAEITYIDLYPLPRFNAAPVEKYVTGDAEEWLSSHDDNEPILYDAILSSAAMQWFCNTREFLRNAFARLRKGGLLALATFAPGNLSELEALRPAPIIYPSAEDLRDWISRHTSDFIIEEEVWPLDFPTPREAMLHLKLTGVGGSTPGVTAFRALHLLANRPDGGTRLTFRPLYIIARKPFC